MQRELGRVKTDLGDDEVKLAENKIASGIVLKANFPGQDAHDRRPVALQQGISLAGNRHGDPDGLSPESLRQLMHDFPFDPMTIVSLGPET